MKKKKKKKKKTALILIEYNEQKHISDCYISLS